MSHDDLWLAAVGAYMALFGYGALVAALSWWDNGLPEQLVWAVLLAGAAVLSALAWLHAVRRAMRR